MELSQDYLQWGVLLLAALNLLVVLTESQSVSQLRGTLTLSWVSIPTMSEDRNPPREDRVLAMPNIVPATASVFSEYFLCYARDISLISTSVSCLRLSYVDQ
jgi:hypothetical protein